MKIVFTLYAIVFAGPDVLERKTRDLIGQNRLGNISDRHLRMRFQHSLRKLMPSGEQKIPEWMRNLGDEGAKLAHALRSNRSPKVNQNKRLRLFINHGSRRHGIRKARKIAKRT